MAGCSRRGATRDWWCTATTGWSGLSHNHGFSTVWVYADGEFSGRVRPAEQRPSRQNQLSLRGPCGREHPGRLGSAVQPASPAGPVVRDARCRRGLVHVREAGGRAAGGGPGRSAPSTRRGQAELHDVDRSVPGHHCVIQRHGARNMALCATAACRANAGWVSLGPRLAATTTEPSSTPTSSTVSISSGTADFRSSPPAPSPCSPVSGGPPAGSFPTAPSRASPSTATVNSPTGTSFMLNPVVYVVSSKPPTNMISPGAPDSWSPTASPISSPPPPSPAPPTTARTTTSTTASPKPASMTSSTTATAFPSPSSASASDPNTPFSNPTTPPAPSSPSPSSATPWPKDTSTPPSSHRAGPVLPNYGVDILDIPEPASLGMLSAGAMLLCRRRRR